MDNKELYAKYGQLMIQAEIINAQIRECKQAIVDEMQKPKPVIEPEVKEK